MEGAYIALGFVPFTSGSHGEGFRSENWNWGVLFGHFWQPTFDFCHGQKPTSIIHRELDGYRSLYITSVWGFVLMSLLKVYTVDRYTPLVMYCWSAVTLMRPTDLCMVWIFGSLTLLFKSVNNIMLSPSACSLVMALARSVRNSDIDSVQWVLC